MDGGSIAPSGSCWDLEPEAVDGAGDGVADGVTLECEVDLDGVGDGSLATMGSSAFKGT